MHLNFKLSINMKVLHSIMQCILNLWELNLSLGLGRVTRYYHTMCVSLLCQQFWIKASPSCLGNCPLTQIGTKPKDVSVTLRSTSPKYIPNKIYLSHVKATMSQVHNYCPWNLVKSTSSENWTVICKSYVIDLIGFRDIVPRYLD